MDVSDVRIVPTEGSSAPAPQGARDRRDRGVATSRGDEPVIPADHDDSHTGRRQVGDFESDVACDIASKGEKPRKVE